MRAAENFTCPKTGSALLFQEGIPGFEEIREFVLLKEDDRNLIFTFQAAHAPVPSLLVLNPFPVIEDYAPVLSEKDREFFGGCGPGELCFLLVSMIRENGDCVVNLKAPLVIHPETRKGRQVILENADYPVRCPLPRGRADTE